MGGRAQRPVAGEERRPWDTTFRDEEKWIHEVSEKRLDDYGRMLKSGGAGQRVDGSARNYGGDYFRDLLQRENARRGRGG